MNKKIKFVLSFVLILFMTTNINAQGVTDWNGFGGNEANNKITYAKTPSSASDINILTTIELEGYAMDPIVINDKMYAVAGSSLIEYEKDGTKTGREVYIGNPGYFSKIATGDNKIFIAAANYIVAVDLDTFDQIWQSEAVAGAQALSAITYHDGYLYSGYTINPTSGSAPSDGFFFAMSVEDENTSKTNEIKDYKWTYDINDTLGHGYYWSDAAIANNAIIFAGDDGKVISHHLTKDIVYDTYQLSEASQTKKVRSTVVYDKKENAIYVGTQDSKELYKIGLVGNAFDRTQIKSLGGLSPISGGLALGSENIYISSGGMSGYNITVVDKDLTKIIGVDTSYGTQSIPLVSDGVDGATYVYFLDFMSGKLLIGKDLNDGSMLSFTEYKDGKMAAHNSGSVIPFYDGTLIVQYNDFSNGGYVFLDSKNKEVTQSDIEMLIAKTGQLTSYTDYDKLMEINDRVATFKANNPDIVLENEAELTTNLATMKADMDAKGDFKNFSASSVQWLKVEDIMSVYYKLSPEKQKDMYLSMFAPQHKNTLESIWTKYEGTSEAIKSSSILSVITNVNNEIGSDKNKALKYKAYLVHLNDCLDLIVDDAKKEEAQAALTSKLVMVAELENIELYAEITEKIDTLPETITLKNKTEIDSITKLLAGLDDASLEGYKSSNEASYQKYDAMLTELTKQQAAIDKLNEDIALIDPNKVTMADEALVNDIITRYEALATDNKQFVSDWYENILDAKKVIDKFTSKVEKKGEVTYTYKKISGKWYLIKSDQNNANIRLIKSYSYDKRYCKTASTALTNCVRLTKVYKETKSGKIIKRKQTITYNANLKVTKNLIQDRNAKGKYINTYYNTKSYYSNKRVKVNKVAKRNLNTNKYTNIKANYYYSNGKRKRVVTNYYSKGKKSKVKDYRYNKKGQLKSNKYGKAYYIQKNYKKGKLSKTYKYKYNAKGKKKRA
ncbi:hypothetical protein LJB88_02590 [Erysipelotrichaceae bacterium OttesenSCG-928-M19]|nr:hypothetical protein [Erysipelotrichaceae bacterium OttesenSCG-928-M19]